MCMILESMRLFVIYCIIPVFNYDVSKWLGVKSGEIAVDDGPVRVRMEEKLCTLK